MSEIRNEFKRNFFSFYISNFAQKQYLEFNEEEKENLLKEIDQWRLRYLEKTALAKTCISSDLVFCLRIMREVISENSFEETKSVRKLNSGFVYNYCTKIRCD